jgi:hypothetical protein
VVWRDTVRSWHIATTFMRKSLYGNDLGSNPGKAGTRGRGVRVMIMARSHAEHPRGVRAEFTSTDLKAKAFPEFVVIDKRKNSRACHDSWQKEIV